MYEDLKDGLTQAVNLEQQISELEDVVASINCQYECFVDDLCQIIFEGEDTNIGRKVTIDRIKKLIGYYNWLELNN